MTAKERESAREDRLDDAEPTQHCPEDLHSSDQSGGVIAAVGA